MDKYYDTDDAPRRARFRSVVILGILFILIGLTSVILSVVDLLQGGSAPLTHHESRGGIRNEKSLWPSSGRGFWVGLVLIATGLIGILSAGEGTRASIIGFAAFSTVSTILSFYMMITSIMTVQHDRSIRLGAQPSLQSNERLLHSLLIMSGAFGSIVGIVSSILACVHADCCQNQRVAYVNDPEAAQAKPEPPPSIGYPAGNITNVDYSYRQPTVRVPL